MSKILNFYTKYHHLLPKEAQEELGEAVTEYGYLKQAFNESPCTISLIDENFKYLSVNKKMSLLLKKDADKVLGKKIGEITRDSSLLKIIQKFKNDPESEKSHSLEVPLADGSVKNFWLTINKVGKNFLIIGSDVTDFKNLEQEKMFSDKMAFLGEMSAFLAHEINNPLMTIGLSNEIIQLESEGNPKIAELTGQVDSMVSIMAKIIESLKMFARREDVEKSDVNLYNLLDNALILSRGKINHNDVKIINNVPKDATIHGSQINLFQVMINLINNSIYAVKSNPEKWIEIRWEDNSLKFIDSGKGIPENILPNLFKKFYTSKGNQGNGIGLHLSKQFLNESGYNLVYKLEGENTSFQWVPVSKQDIVK